MIDFRIPDSMLIGHPQIDEEHKQLTSLFNEFSYELVSLDGVSLSDSAGGLPQAIQGRLLAKALSEHFINEEKIMEELDYHLLPSHKTEHRIIIDKLETLLEAFEHDNFDGAKAEQVMYLLWDDLLSADMGFKTHLERIDYRA